MADLNSHTDLKAGTAQQYMSDEDHDVLHVAFIELLFFAYRDFTSEPDAVLQTYGFGRAHHRVLHFVHRKPGLTVAELLKILKITKQSLARVLKQLIADEFIEQKAGPLDRRQRLLYVTQKGSDLALELTQLQTERIQAALKLAGPSASSAVSVFLLSMVAPQNRTDVLDVISKANLASGLNNTDEILKECTHVTGSNTQ